MKRNLPHEILLTIFNDLQPADLLNCQLVCRSWRSPAQTKLLEEVDLGSNRAIQQFIAFFDKNSNRTYSNAVKSIEIWRVASEDEPEVPFTRETVEKLFFCFPNLEKVDLDDCNLISNFDEDFCKEFLMRCPKLDSFIISIDFDGPKCITSIVKVQPLLTQLHIPCDFVARSELGNPVRLITRFPRLKDIHWNDLEMNFFDNIVPIFEQLPNVKLLTVCVDDDIRDNLEDLPDLIIERLSNITNLTLQAHYDNIDNTLKFISKYFNGLKSFTLVIENTESWDVDVDQDLFCRNTINAVTSFAKADLSITFNDLRFTSLSNNFTLFMKKVFQRVPPAHRHSSSRVLELTVAGPNSPPYQTTTLELSSKRSPFSRNVHVSIAEDFDLSHSALQLFRSDAPMYKVDIFRLHFENKNSRKIWIDTKKYISLLETMPSLKQVQLEVPANFVEASQKDSQPYTGPVLSQVEEATFRATKGGPMQSLLDGCCFVFPNVRSLNIYSFNGVWVDGIGEYTLDLQEYSLEKLTLDVEPVLLKMDKLSLKKKGFFVLEMENQDCYTRHLYKVSYDLSYAKINHDSELKGFKRCKDYLRVRVLVNRVKQVELRVFRERTVDGSKYYINKLDIVS